jgi:hypothetical protein
MLLWQLETFGYALMAMISGAFVLLLWASTR